MDLQRNRDKQGRSSEIEEEMRQRTMHLLERAHNLKLEQEEEIKKCNKLILETKCRAIRDAQVNALSRVSLSGTFLKERNFLLFFLLAH